MIISADDIKAIAAIDIDPQDVSLDTVLESIAASVTADIVSYIGQPVESESVVYQFTGNGTYSHTLPYSRCSAVATAQTRETPVDAWVSTDGTVVIARTEYPAVIYNDSGWLSDRDYRATVTVGWTTIPADILNVAREMAVIRFQELGNGDALSGRVLGVTSKAQNAGTMTATTGFAEMQPRWEQMLSKYRIIPV